MERKKNVENQSTCFDGMFINLWNGQNNQTHSAMFKITPKHASYQFQINEKNVK